MATDLLGVIVRPACETTSGSLNLAPYALINLPFKERGTLLSKLTVGPAPNRELAKNAVEHLKEKVNFENGIRSSAVIYCDWLQCLTKGLHTLGLPTINAVSDSAVGAWQ